MDFAAINTPTAALMAGLVTSLHCAGMCGPLACMLGPSRGEKADATTTNAVYHLSRIAGYVTLGTIAGAVGAVPRGFLTADVVRWFPWLLVVFFGLVALRLDHRLPRLMWVSRWLLKIQSRLRTRSRVQVAVAMGGLTPLLPCGPLYFLIALSAMSGSALRGAEFMLAFGIGTVPLLWLAQSQFGWIRRNLSPVALARFQTGLAVVAAVIISWRLRATLGFEGPSIENFLCH
jgi:sulfite exporter TauE/SafE